MSLAAEISDAARLRGEFTLRSGVRATEYFDKYRFEADPILLTRVAAAMAELLPDDVDALAGLELGGVPLVTALSLHTGLPARFVRKAAKPYGTGNLAEGGAVGGQRLVVIEDVVTSGGQIIESTGALRAIGATVRTALCVIDRDAGGVAALADVSVELRALYRMAEF